MPLAALSRKQIGAFYAALKDRLFDRASNFGKEYLRLLVDEIKVVKKEVHLSGSYSALAGALCMGTKHELAAVPGFGLNWLPSADKSGQWKEYINL